MNPFCIPINDEKQARLVCSSIQGYLSYVGKEFPGAVDIATRQVRELLQPARMPLIHSVWFSREFPDLYKLLIS